MAHSGPDDCLHHGDRHHLGRFDGGDFRVRYSRQAICALAGGSDTLMADMIETTEANVDVAEVDEAVEPKR